MNLSHDGESRIRGYLFMLENSLRTFLKREVVADAIREVESHIRERVRETEPMPNERDALNRLLDAIGPPHRLARAYSAELAADEAVLERATVADGPGRVRPGAEHDGGLRGRRRAPLRLPPVGLVPLIVALMKPIFPDNVGVRWVNGEFRGAGWELFREPGTVVTHGGRVMAISAPSSGACCSGSRIAAPAATCVASASAVARAAFG